nr:immunoglobulin light chain junction region [Macaca mulatta]
CQKYNYSPLTF